MRHYYILYSSPHLAPVLAFVQHHELRYEIHANRTRFWVPEGTVLTEFLLRFSAVATLVDESLDLITGLPP